MSKAKTKTREKRFQHVLESAKDALDEIHVPFHLHAGTALGAHREKTFIPHDHDIDIAVFSKDVSDKKTANEVIEAMKRHGFSINNFLGKLKRGKEIQFQKDNIPLDIFWVYPGNYRGNKYNLVAS